MANLYSSPNNYPSGSGVSLNPRFMSKTSAKNLKLAGYKAKDAFVVDTISFKALNGTTVISLTARPSLWILLEDKSGKSVIFAMSKTMGNSIFVKGAGKLTNEKFIFANKELTTDNLGLAGKTLTLTNIKKTIKAQLFKKYSPDIAEVLYSFLELSEAKRNIISIPSDIPLELSPKDYATISKDYGEIMSAIWCITNMNFSQMFFPSASNEPLVDIYGIRAKLKYPISVKSGGGGKVTIQNIIDKLNARAKTAKIDIKQEAGLAVFQIVNDNSMREGMIKLHQLLNTSGIKQLSKIMKVPVQKISLDNVTDFVNSKSNEELKNILKPFLSTLKTTIRESTWKTTDKLRFIISPLGENIYKELNSNKEIKQSLTNLAKQIVLIQTNIDVNKHQIKFSSNKFKDISFKFAWAGYSGGNKLGFLAKIK